MSAGYWFDTHEHPQHQIAWAARGVIAVEIGDGYWVLPPTRALWIPGGTRHRTGTTQGATMRGIFVAPDRCPVSLIAPTMLRVSPLLRELFDHLTGPDTALARGADAERREHADEPPPSAHPLTATHPFTDTRTDGVLATATRNPAGNVAVARGERGSGSIRARRDSGQRTPAHGCSRRRERRSADSKSRRRQHRRTARARGGGHIRPARAGRRDSRRRPPTGGCPSRTGR
ncbi:AraC family ligand binding domain-containing protein [Nocardia vinacea]|uniref:AraC family ligand binding domain-containing protein n=1 Tax=Nocardia vinacea TaxID=96468 RepID=UPI0035716C44